MFVLPQWLRYTNARALLICRSCSQRANADSRFAAVTILRACVVAKRFSTHNFRHSCWIESFVLKQMRLCGSQRKSQAEDTQLQLTCKSRRRTKAFVGDVARARPLESLVYIGVCHFSAKSGRLVSTLALFAYILKWARAKHILLLVKMTSLYLQSHFKFGFFGLVKFNEQK